MARRTIFVTAMLLIAAGIAVATGAGEGAAQQTVPLRLLVNAGTNTEPGSDQQVIYDFVEEQVLASSGIPVELDVTMAATGDAGDMINLMVAARQIDAWNSNKNVQMLQDDGLLANLNQPLDRYGQNLLARIPEDWKWETVTINGEIRAIPTYSGEIANKQFWVRSDLFDELGLEYDDVLTISQFEEFLSRGAEAYPDRIPLGLTVKTNHWFGELLNGLGEPEVKTTADGEPKPYLIGSNNETARYIWDDAYRERLETLNRWWESGWMPDEFFSWNRADAISIVEQGVTLAVAGEWWRWGLFQNLYTEQGQEWKMIVLTQHDGTAIYHDRRGWDSRAFHVLDGNPDVVNGMVALADWMAGSIDNTLSVVLGIPGVHWEYDAEGFPVSIPVGSNEWGEHDDIVNDALSDILIRVPFVKESTIALGGPTDFDLNHLMAFEPSPKMVATAPADAKVNYADLPALVQERGITYVPADAQTFIQEIELKATLGELTPAQAQAQLQEYARRAGFDAWWAARMEIFRAQR